MRLFSNSGQTAAIPANSSSDEAGEVIENSHTRRSGHGAKSRSLERYAGAPTTKIHQPSIELLPPYATPTSSTRRRFLSPFRSMKRRSRSSSSSNESHQFGSHVNQLNHLNHLNHMVVVNVGAGSEGGVAKAKASSQSGDSGTGGTELEHEMEQDDEEDEDEDEEEEGEELDELSLSYSQLSSSGCDEAESRAAEDQPAAEAATAARVSVATSGQHVADERRRNMLSLYSSSSEEQLWRIGDITLVDDTYSNYDPNNEAERMYRQVVGILRDEKEVCVLANSGGLNIGHAQALQFLYSLVLFFYG